MYARDAITPEFAAQFKQALQISHQRFTKLIGVADYGVSMKENYYLNDNPTTTHDYYFLREFPELFPDIADLKPNEHPFDSPYVARHSTMLIEPSIYLPRMMNDIIEAAGKIVMRSFQSSAELLTLNEPVIFNCTGLGAKELFNDAELMPIRGQLVLLPADERIDYLTHGGDASSGLLYMFPRADGILLGGAYDRGDYNLEPDVDTTARIIRGHAAVFQGMKI